MSTLVQKTGIALALLLLAPLSLHVHAGDTIDPAKLEFFEKRIRPQLVKHCYECHSAEGKKIKGRLRVDSLNAIKAGGDSGPGIVPGHPDKSLVIEAMVYANPDLQMPPENKLPENIVQDFITWVKDGAVWPGDPEAKAVAEEPKLDFEKLRAEHWALKPVKNVAPPAVNNAAWSKDPLDQFILAKLEEKKLSPGPSADPQTLLRRVSIDLTGLPPTPDQIAAFSTDPSPENYAKTVDRLLASPHFGERWGRHWLDVARYAESAGGGRIVSFNNAWRYREYVIHAFNRDKPYGQFIREQIAGDLLPAKDMHERAEHVIATGFLAIGPKNLDTQDKELLRMDVVDEQVDTIGKTILGMTIGCARCHDHKFDPITTKEYYALAAIFRATKSLTPGNVSGVVQSGLPLDAVTQAKLDEHDREVTRLETRLHALRTTKQQVLASPAKKTDEPAAVAAKARTPLNAATLPGIIIDESEASLQGTWIKSTYTKNYVGDNYVHDSGRIKGELSVTYSPAIPKAGLYEIRMSYSAANSRDPRVPAIIQCADGEKTVYVDQRLDPPIDGYFVSLGKFNFQQGNDGSVTISNTGTTGVVTADAMQFLPVDEAASEPAKPVVAATPGKPVFTDDEEKKMLAQLEKELAALKKKAPVGAQALSVREEEQISDYNVCIRGDVHRLGEPVQRGFMKLAAFTPEKSIDPKQSGRVELADWLVDPRNPLTPRVAVNRIWHHLFGAGLVRSTDNFGTTGDRPTHLELLDHLSQRFIDNKGSFKSLIRAIVLSNTYRLASTEHADAAKVDPENKLLWRANRRRLDVEALRDSILQASGQLDLTPPGTSLTRLDYGVDKTAKNFRRTVYLPVEREKMDDMLEVFDFPDPNLVVGTRNTSNIPTQALFLMNSPFVMEHSRKAAERVLAEPNLEENARIDRAYLSILGRQPTQEERTLSKAFLNGSTDKAHWALFYQALFGCLDFRFVN